jgi:hypothetical protein
MEYFCNYALCEQKFLCQNHFQAVQAVFYNNDLTRNGQ